jgi:hypothetical protein
LPSVLVMREMLLGKFGRVVWTGGGGE